MADIEVSASPTADGGIPDRGSRAGERIVVGVDGSDCSLAALRWALDEGDVRGVPVAVVLAWLTPLVVGLVLLPPPSEADQRTAARAQLKAIMNRQPTDLQQRSPGSPVTSTVRQGTPAGALIAASVGAALLVVGSRGAGGFRGLLIGSVSQQCAAHASCPVVVVHG